MKGEEEALTRILLFVYIKQEWDREITINTIVAVDEVEDIILDIHIPHLITIGDRITVLDYIRQMMTFHSSLLASSIVSSYSTLYFGSLEDHV